MFDPRDLATDPRSRPAPRQRRDHAKEREQRQRSGHRREYDPRSERQNFQDRIDRALADIGVYRSVATRDPWPRLTSRDTLTRLAGPWSAWFVPGTSGSTRPVGPKAVPTRCSRSPVAVLSGRSAWRVSKDSTRGRRHGADS